MSNMNSMGGPGGPSQMNNADTPNSGANGAGTTIAKRLNTYIYDHFLRNEMYDLARILYEKYDIEPADKSSPEKKNVNGTHDDDSKDDIPGKPADLPRANVPNNATSSFLQDWWAQFWDCWQTARTSGAKSRTQQYLQHVHNRTAGERQRLQQPMQAMQGMNPRGVVSMPMDMKKAMMMQNRSQVNPALQQQMRMQQQMAAQTMQREGSQIDMNGQQRPHTPGSGDNAPSPKRQRMDGAGFNGQMVPMGRGQAPGMPNQQVNAMQMQQNPAQMKQLQQQYASSIAATMQTAMDANGQKGMQNPNGFSQGSPAMDGNGEVFNTNMRNMQQGGAPNNSNHALQDYQMQLMLLEQQNKKRLLMARQEQETSNGPGGPTQGPSPGPEDQMKRGTPKMVPNGMPQPGMDVMPQGRGSPAVGFDPNQMNPNMAHNFQGMKMPGGMMAAPNGQMMPATSHPAFNAQMNGQFTPQQMELMRQQAGRPNGPWPQGPPPGMMQGGQPPQPNMTPQQRNSNMPPPPAPATGEAPNRTQPSSPQQSNAAPPTPSQANKPNPKSKKESANSKSKKAANKKGGATAATPASESGDQPPTPTPAPPITPTAPAQQFGKNGPQPNGQPSNGPPNAVAPHQSDVGGASFGGSLDGGEMDFSMNFGALDGTDVLDNFDFDSFLNNNDGDGAFAFDGNMNFGPEGGLEAGGDV